MRHFRINDQTTIKTKRLIITPLNAKQLLDWEAGEGDELLRGAVTEMRRNVEAYPDLALWNTGWEISLRQGGAAVGLIGFHGVAVNQTVELGYEIKQAYRGNGYCQEAVKALCEWAFGCDGVYFISVLAAEENAASNHLLEKLKFYRVESPVEGAIAWELERPASAWISVYISFGLALGLMFGQMLFDNMAIGLAIGIGTGLSLGSALDAQDRAARKRENPPKKLEKAEECEPKSKTE